MNFFKESARIFEFYFKKKATKLEPEQDQMLTDVNSLLSAVYSSGYADGSFGALERFKETTKIYEKEEGFQMKVRRDSLQEFFKKTPHIKREEK